MTNHLASQQPIIRTRCGLGRQRSFRRRGYAASPRRSPLTKRRRHHLEHGCELRTSDSLTRHRASSSRHRPALVPRLAAVAELQRPLSPVCRPPRSAAHAHVAVHP
eukprot:364299-Chlamydomonas_euryale.AAC.12